MAPVFAQTEGTRIPKLKEGTKRVDRTMRAFANGGGIMGRSNASRPPSQQVVQLNARIVESQSQVATLTTTNAQLQEQLRSASAAAEPLNAKIAELKTENAKLLQQQRGPAVPSGGEVTKSCITHRCMWCDLRVVPSKINDVHIVLCPK